MIQFNQKEIDTIRRRGQANPDIIKKLKDEVCEVFEGEPMVPKTGIANWSHYYYCPDCSVQLTFQREKPMEHRCPSCGKVFTGEPYNGAWWQLMNAANYNAAYHMAMLWLITQEDAYARKSAELLLEYARYYPDYQVHGDIPYNGPGRSGAQTLDEANFLRTFALAFDLLSDTMEEREIAWIRDRMLLPGAQFLLEHRHRQLHNHEVIINSAIAVIGILFGKEAMVRQALYDTYGFLYQLEKGMQENHIWFEGSFGYHFYALTSFYAFEKFALHTPYSNIRHPNYRAMMEVLFNYLEPEGTVPMMNDTNYVHMHSMKLLYEFPYRELGGERMAFILRTLYGNETRDNLEALLYGADRVEAPAFPMVNYHTKIGAPGHTILRGPQGRYLLLKHDRYGGEHDHYDRLSISYRAFGQPIAEDLGTTGYGARLHYAYYKNTGTHNTLVIGEENQAPANALLTRYEEAGDAVYVDARVDWRVPYQMPDSFTIVQWKEENYRTVSMERRIVWTSHYFIDVMLADGIKDGLTADWVLHIHGNERTAAQERETAPTDYFTKQPFCFLKEVQLSRQSEAGTYRRSYQDGEVITDLYGMKNGQLTIDALGYANPSTSMVSYLIERRSQSRIVGARVIESRRGEAWIQDVAFCRKPDCLEVTVRGRDEMEQVHRISAQQEG